MKKVIDTIIIGGGVSGIGCAKQLKKHNYEDFLVITEDIGGRICTSENGLVNYGAYYISEYYSNVLKFVKKSKKFKLLRLDFNGFKNTTYTILGVFLHPIQLFRLFILVNKFRREYDKFREQCKFENQKKLIEENPFLNRIYHARVYDFIKEEKIEDISKKFAQGAVYLCTFLPLSKVYAFDFIRICLGMLIPSYEFVFRKDKFIKGIEEKIKIDCVINIEKEDSLYKIITKNNKTFYTNNLVVATPIHISKKLLNLKEIKEPATAYMFHVNGTLKEEWGDSQYELFTGKHDTIAIGKQIDGTILYYSKEDKPNLEKYFEDYEIILKKKWSPAFNITGDILLDSNQGKNLYLIGDYNIAGLEDSFISGIYAGNKILGKTKD